MMGLEARQTSKLQGLRLMLNSTSLDGYFIIRKYNELNHRDRAQININSDKT
jgi:hypothetical protein